MAPLTQPHWETITSTMQELMEVISLDELLVLGEQKYRYARDFEVEAVRSLAFFTNADRDIQPDLIENVSWETVKTFFRAEAKRLGQRWFKE